MKQNAVPAAFLYINISEYQIIYRKLSLDEDGFCEFNNSIAFVVKVLYDVSY